ncbi:hypothetical protein CYMTET_55349 [Cymbomonas tetramitiformis]|uniref:Uncharacterized protein n=1 Tax=Cymbomonas tetramitiformis TaxID=36881 RepID=A0AAE0BDI9_9CHLO|nr:hypothetical protein CYMTET_55349 [Cymbomonas tetramitiformis]
MTGDGNADEPDTSTDSTTPAPVPNSPELAPQQTEVQLMNLKFANQQEQHAAAMKWSELQEGASTSKGDKEAAKTTGNAELELKKKLPTFPYAQMILGPGLAYFHDAVVDEEVTMDWL